MNYFLCMHADTKDRMAVLMYMLSVAFNVFNDMYFHEIFC